MRGGHVPLLALGLLFAPAVVAQADPTDDFIEAEMRRQRIPGLSLAVLRDGEIIKARYTEKLVRLAKQIEVDSAGE